MANDEAREFWILKACEKTQYYDKISSMPMDREGWVHVREVLAHESKPSEPSTADSVEAMAERYAAERSVSGTWSRVDMREAFKAGYAHSLSADSVSTMLSDLVKERATVNYLTDQCKEQHARIAELEAELGRLKAK